MKNHWHEQVQRYLNGQSSAEDAAALQEALNKDAELRALYLDYMNLDVALAAAAEMATTSDSASEKITGFPRPSVRLLSSHWPWLAAAACAALALFAMLPRHRDPAQKPMDIAALISSTKSAIAQMTIEPPSSLPSWASPTDSILHQLRLNQ